MGPDKQHGRTVLGSYTLEIIFFFKPKQAKENSQA